MTSDVKKDHDTDISVDEVLARIAAAEALLAEAKAMLKGEKAESAAEVQAVSEAAPERPKIVAAPTADGEFDEELLGRYAPPGPDADFRESIRGLFHLALETPSDREHLGEALRRMMHSQAITGPISLESLLRFGWLRFTKYSLQYLETPTEPASFHVLRTEPSDLSEAKEVKAFLEAAGRGPVPITLRRDESFGKAWRIHAFSL